MSSRIPLIALLALATFTATAAADPAPWNEAPHSARDWWSIAFEDETGQTLYRYFVRGVDVGGPGIPAGGRVPLYLLDKIENKEIDHPYFNVRIGAYYLIKESSNMGSLRVRREGSELDAPARLRVLTRNPFVPHNLESREWARDNPAVEGQERGRWNPAATPMRIVVAKPSDDAKEALPTSILSGNSGRPIPVLSGALDGEGMYPHYYKRTLPLQRVLGKVDDTLSCWADPVYGLYDGGKKCVNRDDIKSALDRSGDGVHDSLITLAVTGRAQGVELAKKIIGAPGPKGELTADEIKSIRGLFSLLPNAAAMQAANARFYTRARVAQGDPIKREQFVAKWRGVIKEVFDEFIEHAEGAGREETPYDRDLASARDFIAHAFETPDVPEAEATAAANAPAHALDAKEKLWLTKAQAKAYDDAIAAIPADAAIEARTSATKAAAVKARGEILANLEPNAEWVAAYKAATEKPDATAADVAGAVPPADKIWGGAVTAAVAPSGPNADVQLSSEELEKLRPNAQALQAYTDAVTRWGGGSGAAEAAFNRETYDPVALHLATLAARRAIAAAPAAAPPAASREPLSENERKMLTAKERELYLLQETEAKKPDAHQRTKDALAAESARLRGVFAAEGRKPEDPAYPPAAHAANLAAIPEADFDKLPEWQKNKLCNDLPPSALAAAPGGADQTRAAGLHTGTDANAGLHASAADAERARAQTGGAGAGTTTTTTWIQTKCGPRRVQVTTTTPQQNGNGQTGGGLTASAPPPPGDGKETPPKEKSKWFTQDLITSGVKGGLIGLLVGSLFGPMGLVIGPIAGAALFYGLTKLNSKD